MPLKRRDLAPILTALAVVAAAALPWLAWRKWGGGPTWPGLIGNFTATILAFLIALSWDRRARRHEQAREAGREEAALSREREAELTRRREEAIQRLAPVFYELRQNVTALGSVETQKPYEVTLPSVQSGACEANGAALAAILADYELTSQLTTFYERLSRSS